eukprot:TRINITY_DN69537_c0_g1_i1.p1 TRINITY_DN69537_c0_g1~~TRINITY_DN69537_c0_g1_i1.p1  ORF type:complete len:475 (-),score=88.80 TRINITY_DN69537_c0_g1_i1:75-1412(-)
MANNKPTVSLVFVGTAKCGATSVAGKLCHLMNGFPDGPYCDCENLAKELGNPGGTHAWMLDKLVSERELGKTLDASMAVFESESCRYTVVDVPADRLLKGLFRVASVADVAVLVISAALGEYEAAAQKSGLREIALSCITMGIKHVVVLVTKIDDPSLDNPMSRFDDIKKASAAFLKEVGYKQKEVAVIPVSGLRGDNLTSKSSDTTWYGGVTAIEAFDALGPINRPAEKPLRLPVLRVSDVPNVGTVVFGRVEMGSIRSGIKVLFCPGGKTAEVQSLQIGGKQANEATGGDIVSFSIGEAVSSAEIQPGMVVSSASNDSAADAEWFLAQVIVLDHPGAIRAGYCPSIAVGTAHVPCEFEELVSKIDRKTGEEVEPNPLQAKTNDVVTARLRPRQPLCVEAFSAYPPLGRFAVRDHGRTVAVGVVKEVTKRSVPKPREEEAYFAA